MAPTRYVVLLCLAFLVLIRYLIRCYLTEMARLHGAIGHCALSELVQQGRMRTGDLLLFEWRPAPDTQLCLMSPYTHVALACFNDTESPQTVESHTNMESIESWPGANQSSGPHMHPLQQRVASYPGHVYHVPISEGVRKTLCDTEMADRLIHLVRTGHYPYYPTSLMHALSPMLLFTLGTIIYVFTGSRHYFACGDFARHALVASGVLPPDHRWVVSTPHSLLGVQTTRCEPIFDSTKICRIAKG